MNFHDDVVKRVAKALYEEKVPPHSMMPAFEGLTDEAKDAFLNDARAGLKAAREGTKILTLPKCEDCKPNPVCPLGYACPHEGIYALVKMENKEKG